VLHRRIRTIHPVVLGLFAALGVAVAAEAAERHVPGQYSTIQAAVAAAQPGDRVIVAPGIYTETIDLAFKPIILIASGGAEVTVINGNNTNTVLRNPGDGAVIGGFTIRRGFAPLGGGIRIDGTSPYIYECIFDENQATYGGAIYVRNNASPIFDSCRITGNYAGFGGGVYCRDGAAPSFLNCVISYNAASNGAGGGFHSLNAAPVIHGTRFETNHSHQQSGGAIYASGSQMTLSGIHVIGNIAHESGGGIFVSGGQTTLANSRISNNFASTNGGGVYSSNASIDMVNVLIDGNYGIFGGGAFLLGAQPKLTNVTISGNTAGAAGGALRVVSSGPQIRNSIIWNNGPDEISRVQDATNIVHSCIRGGWSGAGHSNIDSDPLFEDAFNGNFRISRSSPCVDAGNNNHVPQDSGGHNFGGPGAAAHPFLMDLDGQSRIVYGTVDIGAYEVQAEACLGDVDGDGYVGSEDLIRVLRMWGAPCNGCPEDINGDNQVDMTDLIAVLTQWGPCD